MAQRFYLPILFVLFCLLNIPILNGQAVKVKDIRPGTNSSSPKELNLAPDGTLYFFADDGSSGIEPWKSDGTATGTVLLKDVKPGSASSNPTKGAVTNNSNFFFVADDGPHGYEVWVSDGTSAGTHLTKDIRAGTLHAQPTQLLPIDNEVIFHAIDNAPSGPNSKLFKSDGTATGTVSIKTRFTPRDYLLVGGIIYYNAYHVFSQGYEPWMTDGTPGGTQLIKDLCSGSCHSDPSNFTDVNGTIFFKARNANSNGIKELYKTDGTSAGTTLVKDINPGTPGSEPSSMTNVNGTLFFFANDGTHGRELWKSDGTTAGTVLIKDINPGTSDNCNCPGIEYNGLFYFAANNGTDGYELWQSDGTTGGTLMVKDIRNGNSGSNPANFFKYNNELFFSANDGNSGNELWHTDGTTAGTVMFQDINAGSGGSSPKNFVTDGSRLFFSASDSDGNELWLLEIDQDNDGFTVSQGDCNDQNANVYPGATEICDGEDNNCDGQVDEGFGSIIYVKHDASGQNNGASWQDAYNDLQDAIDVAGNNCGAVEIWVAAGIYKPTKDINGNPNPSDQRRKVFNIIKNIKIFGGFNGTETFRSERDFNNNVTVLSGDIDNNDQATPATSWTQITGSNAFSIVRILYTDHTCEVDGFTISGGRGNFGGGVNISGNGSGKSVSCTVRNLIVCGNRANGSGGGMVLSGGNGGSCTATVENCTFFGNKANDRAGALYPSTWPSGIGASTIVNCLFYDNEGSNGGAIFNLRGGTNPTYSNHYINCTFYGNRSLRNDTGACINNYDSKPKFTNCIFWNNTGKSKTVWNYHNRIPMWENCLLEEVNCGALHGNNNCVNSIFGQDPLLVDPANYDYHLTAGSPAIDQGTATNAPTDDLDGLPRAAPIDIGCYELCQSGLVTCYADTDNDNYGDPNSSKVFCGTCGTGYVSDNTDCDDTDDEIFPNNPELCDGKDNDCDGFKDEGIPGGFTFTYNLDCLSQGDQVNITWTGGCPGWDVELSIIRISPFVTAAVLGTFSNTGSYNLTIPNSLSNDEYQFYIEYNFNGGPVTWTYGPHFFVGDSDGDGFCDGQDCDPNDPDVYPGNTEICDGKDNDCNNLVDTNDPNLVDNDPPTADCLSPTIPLTANGTLTITTADIDDNSYDACGIQSMTIDQSTFDCNDIGTHQITLTVTDVNNLVSSCVGTLTIPDFITISGITENAESCQGASDGSITVNATSPGSPLIYSIDGGGSFQAGNVFNNLSGGSYNILVRVQGVSICEATGSANVPTGPAATTWYKDFDQDGYTDGITLNSCSQPPNFVASALPGDCNDFDAQQYPGQVWYQDNDNDNYTDGTSTTACSRPTPNHKTMTQLAGPETDCDDADANVYPYAAETCNGLDDNCDGQVDEGLSGETYTGSLYFSSQAAVDDFAPCYGVIDGSVTISGTGVFNLSNLSNLTEVTGSITIFLTGLNDLSGLENLTTVGGALYIYYNLSLNDCCAIEALINSGGVSGPMSIFYNAFGCNSITDINANCPGPWLVAPPSDPFAATSATSLSSKKFSIFPNPANREININLLEYLDENISISVFNHLGQQLIYLPDQLIDQSVLNIDLNKNKFSDGIYLISINDGEGIRTKQFILRK